MCVHMQNVMPGHLFVGIMMGARLVVWQFPSYCKESKSICGIFWIGGQRVFTVNRLRTRRRKILSSHVHLVSGCEPKKVRRRQRQGISFIKGTSEHSNGKYNLENCPLVKHQSIELNRAKPIRLKFNFINSLQFVCFFLFFFFFLISQKIRDGCSQFGNTSLSEALRRQVSGACTHSQRNSGPRDEHH